MKKLKRTYTCCAGLTALVLLALLIAGSFADLPISRFLYPGHESSFGQFFAAFGELPAFALLAQLRRAADRAARRVPPGAAHDPAGLRRLPDRGQRLPLHP